VAPGPGDSAFGRTNGFWRYPTSIGEFRILPHYGRYRAMLNDENLGTYSTPRRALGTILAGGIAASSNTAEVARRLPKDLRDWAFVRARRQDH
jgi:hypothetical protein